MAYRDMSNPNGDAFERLALALELLGSRASKK